MSIWSKIYMNKSCPITEYLDNSAFDEKFEVELEKDYIRNIFHVENKYLVPFMEGGYKENYNITVDYMIDADDIEFREKMHPDFLMENINNGEHKGLMELECREKMVDGNYCWVRYVAVTGTENGVPKGKIYFYVFDIQNQKNRENGREKLLSHDARCNLLTGLHVRESFIQSAVSLSKTEKGPWCCMVIDIQHFKMFNTWFGTSKGDTLLSRIGSYLHTFEQKKPVAASYFGGDNFVLFLRHNKEFIAEILEHIKEFVNTYSNAIGFMPAIGIYILEDNDLIGLDMYDKARIALEDAKKSYSERISYFDSERLRHKKEEFELLKTFVNALKNKEISFYLQPQCHISSGKIIGAEALVRWIKPDGTVIPPGAFVPYLENNGFITELDKNVWEAVCKWLRDLINRDLSPLPVSINVSQIDLLSMDVAAYMYALTQKYSIPPRLLKIEITESAYAENFERISHTIANLKKKGFTVFMDDFGSGYSSLNMLDKINSDVIKLDMAFLRKENSLSKKGISIVESIFSMTRALEMPIIVEGVESKEHIKFLTSLGCQYAQGYYFYKPMSISDFESLLAEPQNVDYCGLSIRNTELFHAREFLNDSMFTDCTLNNILGSVAFYTLDGDDLNIVRYNEPFYRTIGDSQMDKRSNAIQNFVIQEDRPLLYRALQDAEKNVAEGGRCEIRFYKSDSSVFWFNIHFFYLKTEGNVKRYYGQIEDVTESREQSISFLEVLREKSDVTLRLNLEQNLVQYVTGNNTLFQPDIESIDLHDSIQQTVDARIDNQEDKKAFIEFFDSERLKAAFQKAIYHEVLCINFRLYEKAQKVEFSTHYLRYSKEQELTVYIFVKAIDDDSSEHNS